MKRSPKPNVVLIVIDTLRSDHLSCYGYPYLTSPQLDELAAESYLFENSYSTSTWTLPSVATLLTGLLPNQHNLKSIHDRLSEDVETIAERLRNNGYSTAAITDGGFLAPVWGFGQGFDRYSSTAGEAWQPKDVALIEAAASRWLREEAQSPFFLLIHTYETHQPYTYREEFTNKFLGDNHHWEGDHEVQAWNLMRHRGDHEYLQGVLALYDGEIARADHYLGRLFETLRETGRYDDSAIIVTSDHGEEFLEHGGVEHGNGKVFEENLRVPLIIKLPKSAAGQKIGVPVTGVDVVPTILDIAGLDVPMSLAGQSLFDGEVTRGKKRPVFAHGLNSFPEIHEERFRVDSRSRSVVFDRVRDQSALFNLESDPHMHHPLRLRRSSAVLEILNRLQFILAWTSGEPRYLVRLPAGTASLVLGSASGIEDAMIWESLTNQQIEPGELYPLSPRKPSLVVFDLHEPASKVVRLVLTDADSGDERTHVLEIPELQVTQIRSAPIHCELPPPLVVRRASPSHLSLSVGIDDATAEELRALGYLGNSAGD